MSLKYADSFDGYVTADMTDSWEVVNTVGQTIEAGTGRFGTNCLRQNGGGGFVGKLLNTAQATFTMGAAFQALAEYNPSLVTAIFQLFIGTPSGSGLQAICQLALNKNFTLSMQRLNPTSEAVVETLGTTTFVLRANLYYYIEWQVTIGPASGGVTGAYEVRVNEETVLSGVNVNTDGVGARQANQVRLKTLSRDCRWDDFYICDTAGGQFNGFQGDVHIEAKLANAAGSNTEMTPVAAAGGSPENWDMVNEAAPDDENTYVSGVSPNQDTYNFQDTAIPYSNIRAVQIRMNVRGDPANATPIIRGVVRDGVTDYSGTNTISTINTYLYRYDIFETHPAGGAWTRAQVDADQFGIEVV